MLVTCKQNISPSSHIEAAASVADIVDTRFTLTVSHRAAPTFCASVECESNLVISPALLVASILSWFTVMQALSKSEKFHW